MNSTNSCEYLLEMLQVSNDGTSPYDISRAYVLDVFPYISDMRVLQNIFNEFVLYRSTLKEGQNLSLRDEEIFSLIVFKNLYPDQFARLQHEEGIIKEAFSAKARFIDDKTKEITDEMATVQEKLDNIASDALRDIRELKCAMLGALTGWVNIPQSLRQSYSGTSYSVRQILDDDFDIQQLCDGSTWYGEEFIAEDTASLLYQMPLKINRTVFGLIWEYVPTAEKFAFMLRHLHILESADFDHYLVELGSPYDGFKRKSSRHSVIIADNKDNRALVERLLQVQHITSFSTDKQAFKNSKTEQKQVAVLKCRVKATD